MEMIGMFEARTKFSEYVRAVAEEGREFMITNRGEGVARLVPADSGKAKKELQEALDFFADLRKRVKQPVLRPGETWKDLGREGLKW